MNRKQKWITGGILCALAILCLCMTVYVTEKAKPENLFSFEKRFADQTALGWSAKQTGGSVEVNASDVTRLVWQEGNAAVSFETQPISLESFRRLLVNATIAGQQNANAWSRWNYCVWMELEIENKEGNRSSSRVEVALESDKNRGRIYAAEAMFPDHNDADQYTVKMIIEPLENSNGMIEAGWLEISKWEVYPR